MRPTANTPARNAAKGFARTHDNETRERIIREARGIFLERGYNGAAMSQLAKRAGVTTPALYWHFASKAELCGEIVRRDHSDFLAGLVAGTVGDTSEQRLRSFVATFVESELRARDASSNTGYTQLLSHVSHEARAAVRALKLEILETLRRVLRQGKQSGEFSIDDLTLTTFAIITMCEYVYVWYRADGRLSPADVGALYADLAVDLVTAP